MLSHVRTPRRLLLVLCLALYAVSPVRGADEKADRVGFDTVDGVKIEGTFYPSSKTKDAACVILLHDLRDADGKPGSSRTEGWDNLAKRLQGAGFAVLSFDFRGFGESKAVTETFWKQKNTHNVRAFPAAAQKAALGKPPETIAFTQFPNGYYPHLVNDIAAAKAFLDTKNDGMSLNSRNVIVIGAGQGATLGLMWMESEYRRYKGIVRENPLVGGAPIPMKLDEESAGRDLVAGIWLTISPTLQGVDMPVYKWVYEVGKTHKLPMVFLFGKEDPKGDKNALFYLQKLSPSAVHGKKVKDLDFTSSWPIDGTKLTSNKLLSVPATEEFIAKKYLEPLMEKHRFVEWKVFNNDDSHFYWKMGPNPGQWILAKIKGEKMPVPMPGTVAGLLRP